MANCDVLTERDITIGPYGDMATTEDLSPANLVWRMALGTIDGSVTLGLTIALAWFFGVLPSAEIVGAASNGFRTDDAGGMLALGTQVGVILLIRVVIVFLYDTTSVALGGQSIGGRLLRLRIVSVDGTRVALGGALKRAAAGGLIAHTPVLGQALRIGDYGAALLGRRRQAVRDKVAGTMLVHARRDSLRRS